MRCSSFLQRPEVGCVRQDAAFAGTAAGGGACGVLTSRLRIHNTTGLAMKIVLYVPATRPTTSRNENPRRAWPAPRNRITTDDQVKRLVMIVRLRVSLIALFIISR